MPAVSSELHGWVDPTAPPPRLLNVPNVITLLRTVTSMLLAVAALTHRSAALAVAAYLTYWLGDILDGLSARLLHQETRIGAVLDVLSDRACCAVCAAALLVLRPQMAVPLGLFLVQFMVLDCMLSLSFLQWPLLSPNYFALVHPRVYKWHWWPPAKAVNSSLLVVLVLFSPSAVWTTALVAVLTAVKVVSLVAVGRLNPRPNAEPAK